MDIGLKTVAVSLAVCTLAMAAECASHDVKLRGYVGRRMDACIHNHILKHDACYLTDPYKDKSEDHYWQCEFWGKWMHSAAPFLMKLRMEKGECKIAEELRANIAASVENLLPCQEECGYLGNYAPAARCGVASRTSYGGWDVWCQKYTLLGLLYADECLGDKRCLDAACRHLDWLMAQVGPGKKDIGKTGRYHGLASLSILEPVVWLYRRTGKKEYLDFATYIVSRMDAPEGGGCLISKALSGVDVADRTSGKDEWEKFACSKKAYEMLSCYQGLLGYYRVTSERSRGTRDPTEHDPRRCLDAAVATAKSIIDKEINIVGGAASQELWYHGKSKQTHPYYRMNETCVVTTWLRFCETLLEITGDPIYADEMERTFYNIYLATLSRDGSTFAQYTGLEGTRSAGLNNCFMEENCCNANGPRGFVSFMRAFLTARGDAAELNFYETATASVMIPALKEKVTFEVFTLYPKEGEVRIVNRTAKPLDFTLKLRIPAWSAKTEVKVNGEAASPRPSARSASAPYHVDASLPVPGKYFELRRTWLPGDKVEIVFDMPCRAHLLNNHVAFTRGPIVLARDARFHDGNLVERMRAIDFKKGVELRPVPTGNGDIWMAFAAFLPMGAHSESPDNVHPQPVKFCDFASAGNTWTDKSAYRVWIPVELRPWDTPMDSPEELP